MGEDFCGCCGNETRGALFCSRCSSRVGHLGSPRMAPWDRTYEAVHGEPCPLQVGGAA